MLVSHQVCFLAHNPSCQQKTDRSYSSSSTELDKNLSPLLLQKKHSALRLSHIPRLHRLPFSHSPATWTAPSEYALPNTSGHKSRLPVHLRGLHADSMSARLLATTKAAICAIINHPFLKDRPLRLFLTSADSACNYLIRTFSTLRQAQPHKQAA